MKWTLFSLFFLSACAQGVVVGPVTDARPDAVTAPEPSRLVVVATSSETVSRWIRTSAESGEEEAPGTHTVGTTGVTTKSAIAADTERALLSFDLSALPTGAKVERAMVFLTLAQPSSDWGDWEVLASAAGPRPPGELSWKNQPRSLDPAFAAVLTSPSRVEVDVTPLVRDWLRGAPNHGITLRGHPEGAARSIRFHAHGAEHVIQVPQLVVTYVL